MAHHARWASRRSGRVNALFVLFGGGALIVALLGGLLRMGGPGETVSEHALTMYCAAGLRNAVEEVAADYEEQYGIRVELQYGGSNSLLNQMQVNKFDTADLFLAGDDFYTDKARDLGLAVEVLPIAYMRPVIVVPQENPHGIGGIRDLLRPDLRVALGDPDQAAIGRAVRKRLSEVASDAGDLWSQLEERVTADGVFKPTVTDVANDVRIGTVDAGIVWDSTVAMPKYRTELAAIPVPELDGDPNLVSVCVLSSSQQPTAALRFARFLTARDRGLPAFQQNGMQPVDGDVWADHPQITFFCGAVNRRAVDAVVEQFEQREGVSINTVYDGCGILTGRMKAIDGQQTALGFPDVYMACDRYYLDNVRDWFQEDVDVSQAEIVIAVPKGSSKVRGLEDLVRPGVRVAVGQPDQCTIGALTRRLLVREGLYHRLQEKQTRSGEVVVEKASSALLIPDVISGHVDAAVAYITDTIAVAEDVDIVRVASPLNLAVQPFSIGRTSDHKYLARRLFARIGQARDDFETAGFHFRLDGQEAPASDGPVSLNSPSTAVSKTRPADGQAQANSE